MKTRLWFLAAMLCMVLPIFANGVLVTGEGNNQYYQLLNSSVTVSVEDQVAVVTTSQEFSNLFADNLPKYVFPMPEGASATQLRWYYNMKWYIASFAPIVQDSLPPNPSGGWPFNLQTYMGDNPLFYNFDNPIDSGENIRVELTYVQLLPYSEGNVSFNYKNNYTILQNDPLGSMNFTLDLSSQRSITGIEMIGLPGTTTNDGTSAQVHFSADNVLANTDYRVVYSLDPEQFGLFSLSTKLNEVPDDHPEGFFLFIAEPDPNDNQVVIDKTFSLIIDRSGSMYGYRMTQAKNVANYIINHLNPNDVFNILSFSDGITDLWGEHLIANTTNRQTAINYVNSLQAVGATNISGAFSSSVPQFNNANPANANIIIFITDGEPTYGITETSALRAHVASLFNQVELDINLFNFGIGANFNQQLLTLLALDHNGLAAFLNDNEFEPEVTAFFNKISNPVLIQPSIEFSEAAGITEVYPPALPNVYQGYQMLVSGRYGQGGATSLVLNGQTYNQPVSYEYDMELAETLLPDKQFLTKIWAKMKIEYLMTMYHSHPVGSAEAEAYKQQIIDISLAYGVISAFTSFTSGDPDDPDDPGTSAEDDNISPQPSPAYSLKGNFPNPFNPSTTIRFSVNRDVNKLVKVKIYNLRGQVVKVLALQVNGKGDYEVIWDGTDMLGKPQPSAVYFYVIDFGSAQLSGRMVMSK